MINFARWKIILILFICLMGAFYASPNMMGADTRAWMERTLPGWAPTQTVNLGLDLQGGSYLLLEVEVARVIRDRAEDLVQSARPELRTERVGYTRLAALPDGMRLTLREGEDPNRVRQILRGIDRELTITVNGTVIEARYSEAALQQMQDRAIDQSIEIVRRRVDETGTREPDIRRQGDSRIILQLPGVDDPERIKELLGRTAQLSFHLVDTGVTRDVGATGGSRTLPMADMPGETIDIQRRAMLTGDMLTNAQPTFDQHGQPVVSFNLNAVGARRFCDVTRQNVNRPFAIVLDNEVISAPNIREPICGGAAQISGSFTLQEVNDLALLLRAGALPAPLHVLEERTVGPSLGADSVEAGKIASIYALGFIIAFMILVYGLFGVFACVALLINLVLVFAILSGLQATLTLPGIAGIVLTLGMAVDANVLIFERIKEELRSGRSVLPSVDSGYSKAMSSIIDANVTTLIAAAILMSFGTGPIKGFAVTLSIGVMTSMFSAIMVTRLLVVTWLLKKRPSTITV